MLEIFSPLDLPDTSQIYLYSCKCQDFFHFLYLNVFYFLYTPHSLHLPMGVKLAPYCFVCMNNAKMKIRELIFLQHIASTSLAIYIKMRLRDHMEVLSIIFYELL